MRWGVIPFFHKKPKKEWKLATFNARAETIENLPTFRGIWKENWYKIRVRIQGIGPEFSPEMMIEVLRARQRVIEIPVSYYARVSGSSKHSENYWKISRTALRMLNTIFRKLFLAD